MQRTGSPARDTRGTEEWQTAYLTRQEAINRRGQAALDLGVEIALDTSTRAAGSDQLDLFA